MACLTIAAQAGPCYTAIRSSTGQSNTAANVVTGTVTGLTDPACAQVDAATFKLLQAAVAAKTPVTVAPSPSAVTIVPAPTSAPPAS